MFMLQICEKINTNNLNCFKGFLKNCFIILQCQYIDLESFTIYVLLSIMYSYDDIMVKLYFPSKCLAIIEPPPIIFWIIWNLGGGLSLCLIPQEALTLLAYPLKDSVQTVHLTVQLLSCIIPKLILSAAYNWPTIIKINGKTIIKRFFIFFYF